MKTTLAFDVYGTLINTHGVVVELENHVGDKAQEFSEMWRNKQLEYSFRRALMQEYKDFSVCTAEAFDFTSTTFDLNVSQEDRESILGIYKTLPTFVDVNEGLLRAKQSGFELYAFSNGSAEAIEQLLSNAGIRDYFLGVVSAADVRSFKPNPVVYNHFLNQSGSAATDTWLISGNPFDVMGAINAGMRSAWVQRSPQSVFDPWGIEPTLTLQSLANLADEISKIIDKP